MNYLKIAETAHKCQIKRSQISEYYRMIGANSQFSDETVEALGHAITEMEAELRKLESKLRSYCK